MHLSWLYTKLGLAPPQTNLHPINTSYWLRRDNIHQCLKIKALSIHVPGEVVVSPIETWYDAEPYELGDILSSHSEIYQQHRRFGTLRSLLNSVLHTHRDRDRTLTEGTVCLQQSAPFQVIQMCYVYRDHISRIQYALP